MSFAKKLVASAAAVGVLAGAGVVGATVNSVFTSGSGSGRASLSCPGGMTRLGHPFDQEMSIFGFDPPVTVNNVYTVVPDFFKVEAITMGSHAGTHIDVPAHFVDEADGARTLDQLAAEEFVWPAYKIDVRGESFADNFVTVADIRAYEQQNGRIKRGSLVVLQTGAEEFFGLDGEGDMFLLDEDTGLSDNMDDLFDFENAGFSGEAVQWLFDNRQVDGIGSDAYGPDAFGDEDFSATYTALANDGIALVGLANLDSMTVRKDIVMAPAVNLTNGSGFSVDPLACHGRDRGGWGWGWGR